jgi:hypothetical protein
VVIIDTAAANSDISLAVQISTDADNNAFVNTSEIGSSSTFTARATFSNSTAKAGDKITLNASNDGSALTPVTVTLTSTDVTNGYVETTFAKPAEGKVQQVTASYTDLAGNAAAGTVSDSATLDTTTPTIVVNRSGTGTMIGSETITFTLSEASTDFDVNDVVFSGGQLTNFQGSGTTYTATFTPTANATGTASVGVQASAFKDAAGNNNADDYRNTGAENTNNQVSTAFNTVLPTATITQINGDGAPTAPPALTITDSTTGTAANGATTTFTFTFDQAVKGFTSTDVTLTDSNGNVLTITPTGTWADGQTVYTGTVTAPASGAGSYAVIVADGSFQSNSASVPGYGNSTVQPYAASQDGYSSTSTARSGGNGDVGVSIALSNGNYIWSTNMGQGGLDNVGKAQIFNSSGGLFTSSLTVPTGFLSPAAAGNVSTSFYVGANNTSYAALPGGGFVVAYTDDASGNSYNASIWVVKYDNNGTMLSTTTQANTAVVSNAYGSAGASGYFGYTSITPTANGNYVLTYARTTVAGDPTNAAIYAVEIDGSTNAIVSGRTPSLISSASFTAVPLNGMDATTLADGKIVVSWAQKVPDGVFTRVLNADGTPLAGSNVMQSLSTATQHDSINTIATPDGGFLVVSTDQTVANNAGNGVIKAIKYTVSGNTVTSGTVTTVSTANVTGTDNNKNPAAAVLTNGNIVITWENQKTLAGAFYRIYDANLNPISPARNIPGTALSGSTLESNTISHTVVTALPDGGFVIGVSGAGTAGGVGTQQVFFSADGKAISTNGTTGDNTQLGGAGADTLTGGGGADIILAGEGNDTVVINASNISSLTTAGKLLDGGAGVDTLRISANASTLDLSKSAVQANVQNFEKIDLGSDAVVNTIILNATAVQRLATQNLDGSTSNKQLIIDGTSSDIVKLSGQYNNGILAGYWQQSSTTPTRVIGGVTYKVYTITGLSGVEVLVNNAITSANTDTAYQMASGDITTVPSNSGIVGDLETTATGGSTGSGDGGSQQPLATSSTTSDVTPLVKGTLSQALTGTQVLKLYRSNVTDGGSAVEVSANVTTSGTSWQFQDSGLTAGKQYRYEAKIMDGSTQVDASNTYTINEAVSVLPTNAGVSLTLSISTDADNNTWVNTNEIGSGTTFTARANFSNSAVKAGDVLTFAATNGSTALTNQSVTLSANDVSRGYVDVTFAKPNDGTTQTVTVRYTDVFGNAASDAAPSDSATLDTTAPNIALARTDSNGTVVGGVNTLKVAETGTITLTLSEAPASGTLTATDIVSSAGATIGAVTAVSGSNGLQWTVQYTPPANAQGTDTLTVAASVFTDVAGNLNQDTYLNPAPSGQTYQANNQTTIAYDTLAPTQTVTLSSMTKDSGTSSGANSDWSSSDGSAGRLVSGFISAPLASGEVVKVYGGASGTTFLGDATLAAGGTTWAYTDTSAYNASWTYRARVVDAVGNEGTAVSRAVTFSAAASTSVGSETANADTITFGSTVSINTLAGNDLINASTNTTLAADLSAGTVLINGGAGVDTLRLAAGTTLNLGALTGNQTVKPLQEVEVIEMQGTNSVLTMTANNVLSLGGSNASTMSGYNFGTVTNAQGGGTSSSGKVQMVVLGNTGDTLNLQALANDGVSGTGLNAGILGNSNLAGSWSYKGDVSLGGISYKVYDHSTTSAQVLAKVDVTVNTLTPIAISSIVDSASSSNDTGTSASDFVTSDQTLTYTGTVPVLAAGEKVMITVRDSSNNVVYTGDATLNGTNWSFDRTGTTLAAGNYVINAQIVDNSNNPVAAYGALGSATRDLIVDTGVPAVAVSQSGTGSTRTITFTLSEASTSFDANDVDVTGGTLSNFMADTSTLGAKGGYTRYTATFTANSGFSGTATVGVLNNTFTDIAGNANLDTYTASPTSPLVNDGNNQVSITVDGVPPTVAISSNQLYLNSGTNTATITFTFSEAVVQGSATNQFDLSDVVFTGGTLTALTPVNGTGDATNGYTQYTATFTAATNSTADGFVGIQNGKFADAAGNLNRDTYVAGVTGAVQESDNSLTMPVNTSGTIQVFNITGNGQNQIQAGFDLHGVGDVNGDGREDFMVTTRGDMNNAKTVIEQPSRSYVVFGSNGLDINGLDLTSLQTAGNGKGFAITGTGYNDYFPATNGAGGFDYNGDGLADIVMNNGTESKSYVVYGKTNTNPVNLSTGFQPSDGFTIAAPSGTVYSTPVGDMNGDGFTDTFMAVNPGGYVLYGTSANTNVTIPSGQTGSSAMGFFVQTGNAGTSIQSAPVVGDFNGDGYSDFAVQEGAGNSTGGPLSVVFGGPSNIANLVAGSSSTSGQIGKAGVGFQVTGFTRVDDGLGIPGTLSGDINGDGLTDLIVNNQRVTGENNVYVVFGKTSTTSLSTAQLSSGTSTNGFRIFNSNWSSGGSAGDVDVVGDFNGDGLADMIVSTYDVNNVKGGAWLVYGKTSGTNIDLASINATDGFKIMSDTTDNLWGQDGTTVIGSWNQLGWSVAAAGDLNGDGFADLIISNPHKDTNPTTGRDSGATYVVYGGQFPSGSPTVFSAASGDKLGTAGDDTLAGTSGNNQIVAGAGNDTLTGAGGADALYGGAGNDTMVLNASNVSAFANTSNSSQSVMKVDGGTGLDTLKLDGAGITLDLTAITQADLASTEAIDITGSGNNTLRLSMRDVLEMGSSNAFNVNTSATDTRVQLMITGDNGDAVQLTDLGSWSQSGTFIHAGETYNVYNNGNAQLLIDQNMVPTT